MAQRKLFCEYGPVFYQISLLKEYLLRDIRDVFSSVHFCSRRDGDYPCVVVGHCSAMLRKLEGVDMRLQYNKIENLRRAAAKVDGAVIMPGETFSFWRMIGKTGEKEGYLPGLTIAHGKAGSDFGGGLCQLANLIHWMVLHSPLTVTELHHHTDSLFPDSGRRVPFGTGTSVFYKNVDYRFSNGSDRPVQLKIWLDGESLYGEIRTTHPFPHKYRIEEVDHFFSHEGDEYYRNSKIYRRVTDRETKEQVAYELILQNHSKVLYDPALIPPEELVEGGALCSRSE